MLYSEYKKIYKWLVKKYPDVVSMFTDSENPEKIILLKTTHQEKTGTTWKTTTTEETKIDFIHYSNIVNAIPFFKNLGGTETVTRSYTKYGLIPIKIISTSPGREQRTIREFKVI
jgi:hypothetical protein